MPSFFLNDEAVGVSSFIKKSKVKEINQSSIQTIRRANNVRVIPCIKYPAKFW